MIDTKKLREWAAESENANQLDRALKSVFDELDRVTAERDALKADAERYRHIKPMARVFCLHMDGKHSYCMTGAFGRLQGPTLDAAIDAAIHASKGGA